jgi:uncharacterized protein YjbI with pentapeptide repeats
MIHKNLTPFYWGPKVTSRKPPQPELAVCVRGVFRLVPGQPVVAVEDPIQQGFMSGDTFAPDDIDQQRELLHGSDFADWKLHGEVLVTGACHPPGGEATSCEVRCSLGSWSKSLVVTGPRVYKPGLLLGGTVSEPQPFRSMPLTWQNAYGGVGYAGNPVGRGFAGLELPTVEHPKSRATKTGKNGIQPGTFAPVSPNWPPRTGKRGKKYDAHWKKHRAPFVAEDFDWTHFQSALPDQWLPGYLRGDEELCLENLHPEAPVWRTKLPGLRVRAFVKTADGTVHEPEMVLDTLHAELEHSRLVLVWRGHAPIQKIDMSDVVAVLIASEPLAAEPKPAADYVAVLAEFEADPVGLQSKLPPGFAQFAAAVEAFELAERNGEPLPDLEAVKKSLPPDCPFPPWFLGAVAGEADPLGVGKHFPKGMLDGDLLASQRDQVGQIDDAQRREPALQELAKAKDEPKAAVRGLEMLVGLLPPEKRAAMQPALAAMQKALAEAPKQAPPAASPAPTAAVSFGGALTTAVAGFAAAGKPAPTSLPGSLDAVVAPALLPLDQLQLPELPKIPDVEGQLAAHRAAVEQQEAKLRAKDPNEPMLGMFALFHGLIDKAPRLDQVVPDLSPIVTGLTQAHAGLAAQGVGAAALAPLTRLVGKVEKLVAALPKPKPKPTGGYAGQDLRGRDFRGQDLRGANFAGAQLQKANFQGANLATAILKGADLQGADLTKCRLSGCDATGASFAKALLVEVEAAEARFADADFAGADLTAANLRAALCQQAKFAKAKLTKATLVAADLRYCDFGKAELQGADCTDAKLGFASLELVRADGAVFRRADFDLVRAHKARLRGADLCETRCRMGSFGGADLTGAKLDGCRFHKVDFMKAVLDAASCRGSSLQQAILRDTQAHGAVFHDANLTQVSATGAADFSRSDFTGAVAPRSVWLGARLDGAVFTRASLPAAYFQDARGEDTVFRGAQLTGACLRGVQLVRPVFEHADLASADFNESRLDGADFRAANCYDAKFLGAKAVRSDFTDAFLAAVQMDDPEANS